MSTMKDTQVGSTVDVDLVNDDALRADNELRMRIDGGGEYMNEKDISPLSCWGLAMQLPALYRLYDEHDYATLQFRAGSPGSRRGYAKMRELDLEGDSIRELILKLPAHSLHDVAAQLVMTIIALETNKDEPSAKTVGGTIRNSLAAVVRLGGVDLGKIGFACYEQKNFRKCALLSEVASPVQDAELIGLCEQFDALQRRIYGFDPGGATPVLDDDERQATVANLMEEQRELLDRIEELRAVTQAGFLARARMLRLFNRDDFEIDGAASDDWHERMANALVRDMAGMDG